MAKRRKYNVKGSKDFIVLAGIFFFLCLWSIKDGWYPSPKTLKKHPLEVEASFEREGAIAQLHVKQGSSVNKDQLLAELGTNKVQKAFDDAKEKYAAAKDEHYRAIGALRDAKEKGADAAELERLGKEQDEAKAAQDAALAKLDDARDQVDACRLLSPSKGVVKEVRVSNYDVVKAGDPVVVINPEDHFYRFNKSLAIFSFVAFWIFLIIHIFAH